MRGRRAVTPVTAIGVAVQLARDRRRRAAQAPRDRADRLTARGAQGDLLTLSERQAAAFEIAAAARTNAAAGPDPPRALLAIRADLLGRAADELAALQRRPEHLKRLGVHPIGELTHRAPLDLADGTRRNRRAPGAGARVDRRYTSPSGLASAATDDHPTSTTGRSSEDPAQQAAVAITARTQGTLCGTCRQSCGGRMWLAWLAKIWR